MDAHNRYLAASKVTWEHAGTVWTEELRPQDKLRLSIIDRITVADYALSDVIPDEQTQVWFAGRLHTVTEDQLHSLKLAVKAAVDGMMGALADAQA